MALHVTCSSSDSVVLRSWLLETTRKLVETDPPPMHQVRNLRVQGGRKWFSGGPKVLWGRPTLLLPWLPTHNVTLGVCGDTALWPPPLVSRSTW